MTIFEICIKLNSMIVYVPAAIQDGCLDSQCGRLVIFDGKILLAYNQSTDHNDLLRSFAARFHYNRDQVINQAIRGYFRKNGQDITFCGVRKIDNLEIEAKRRVSLMLISRQFGRPNKNHTT